MRKLALIVAICVLAVAGYFAVQRRMADGGSRKGSGAAPHIFLTDLNGNSFNTSSYHGKVVLVNFWAAWCTPCTAEIPQFVQMQEKYRQQGLQILGVSMDDADDVLRKFYREHTMNYPVVAGDLKIADAYGGVLGLPTTFVIGRDGSVRGKLVGATDFSKLEQEVEKLLHEGGL